MRHRSPVASRMSKHQAVFQWTWGVDILQLQAESTDGGADNHFTTWLDFADLDGAAGAAGGFHVCLNHLRILLDPDQRLPLIEGEGDASASNPDARKPLRCSTGRPPGGFCTSRRYNSILPTGMSLCTGLPASRSSGALALKFSESCSRNADALNFPLPIQESHEKACVHTDGLALECSNPHREYRARRFNGGAIGRPSWRDDLATW